MDSEELDKALSDEFDRLEAENEPEESIDDLPEDPPEGEEEESPPEDKPEDKEETPKEPENVEEDNPPVETEFQTAPKSWTPEAKSKYSELPDWAKREAHKRETDVQAGVDQLKQEAALSMDINKAVKPFKQFLEATGIPVARAARDGVELAAKLRSGTPQERGLILKSLAKQFQADLTVEEDPNAAHLEPLYREINALKEQLHSTTSQTQEASQEAVNQTISAFENELDESGQLKHLYFSNVQDRMAELIQSGRATTLEDAYDRAVFENPETRALVLAEQQRAAEEKRKADAKEQADKLRKANNVSIETRGGHDTAAPQGTMDDTLSAAYDTLTA